MWQLLKSRGYASARSQIAIKEVKEGVLILSNNLYRLVIETSSVNFELKSEAEQDALIDNFQNFLNALPCPIQILVRVRELDTNKYLEEISASKDKEAESVYKEQLKDYSEFIKSLVVGNKVLSRRFYVVVSYTQTESGDFTFVKQQLALISDLVIKGLEKLGMKGRKLSSFETLNLFYTFYNPEKALIQDLKEQTLQALASLQHV